MNQSSAGRINSQLSDVLAYENRNVVERFASDQKVSLSFAEKLFLETKRWLWLCSIREESMPPLAIYKPMTMIDEMWHTFILFTSDYTKFCHKYFGHYIHHEPTSELEKRRFLDTLQSNPDRLRQSHADEYRSFLECVYDYLGGDVVQDWFIDIPNAIERERSDSSHAG